MKAAEMLTPFTSLRRQERLRDNSPYLSTEIADRRRENRTETYGSVNLYLTKWPLPCTTTLYLLMLVYRTNKVQVLAPLQVLTRSSQDQAWGELSRKSRSQRLDFLDRLRSCCEVLKPVLGNQHVVFDSNSSNIKVSL